jgi:probable DNA repair protein
VEQLVECSQQRSRRTPAEWAHFLTDLLEQAGWPGAANLDSEAWQTLRSWNELLAAFAGTHTVLGELTRREALAALSQLAEQRLFQPEGAADGVQVMGVLEAAGHCFDRLWVTGMARELWPRSGRPDAFIPLKLQRRLGLPDSSADTVLGYATQLTQRLLASATEVIVSWPEQLEGESLTASPLLANIETTSGLTADAVPLWNQQALAAVRTELLGADAPPPWRGSGRVRGGVSVLNRQATSPLNAFIEKRLGAAELRRPPVGIDAMRRGNLTHKVLEEFYTAHPSHPAVAALTPADRRAALTAQLENALQALPGIHEAFMRKLADFELVQQLQRLEAFIELDLRREDFKVSACEVPTEVQIGPLMLKLKLDRLDTLPNGRQLVIDYKTGRVNRQDWNPNNPRDLQLPLYVTAIVPDADAVSFAQVSVHGVRFDGVGSGESGVEGIRSPGRQARVQVKYQQPHTDKLIESWDELRHVWAELLVELADKFVAGDFRLDPRNPESARGQFAVLSRVYDEGSGLLEDDA